MAVVVSPPESELKNLRSKLTKGEEYVCECFKKFLSDDWQIYLQPPMNGLRPDIVLMNPKVGLAVFEIKDWDLSAMRYRCEIDHHGTPKLMATNQGGIDFVVPDPVRKSLIYRSEIRNLYCPTLEKEGPEGQNMGIVTAGVIFTHAKTDVVETLLNPIRKHYIKNYAGQDYLTISGIDRLTRERIREVLPVSRFPKSKFPGIDRIVEELKPWMREDTHAKEQRRLPKLDRIQERLASERTPNGYRRIKGAAGSGKSLVLANKAARLANQLEHPVLLTSYNITMMNYLKDLTVRFDPAALKHCVFIHFHGFVTRICDLAGLDRERKLLFDKLFKEGTAEQTNRANQAELVALLSRAREILNASPVSTRESVDFGALLLDEGQDFYPEWWSSLRDFITVNGQDEFVMVADYSQDLYGTAFRFEESMKKLSAGFAGPWSRLSTTYRCPPALTDLLNDYHSCFLTDEEERPQRTDPETNPQLLSNLTILKWTQISSGNSLKHISDAILNCTSNFSEIEPSRADLTFITLYHDDGLMVVEQLEGKGINISHIFAENQEKTKPLKFGFFMGSEKMKGCTVRSFKGWEARLILFYIPKIPEHLESNFLMWSKEIYVGLSRLLDHELGSGMHVLCAEPRFMEFGKTWPEFQDLVNS